MKGVVLLAAGVLAAIAFAALSPVFTDWGSRALVIVPALAGIALLYRFDSRREVQEEKRAAQSHEERFLELSALAEAPQFELSVSGSSQFHYGALVVLTGAVVLSLAVFQESIGWALGGLAVLAFGLLGLMATLPTLGKPKIFITKLGFATPMTPFVPWQRVEGIDLEKVYHRETLVAHYLHFLMPTLPLEISRYGWFLRVLHKVRTRAGKQRLTVVLKNTREHPEVIHRLIRHLWTANTGRTRVWIPGMSETFNDAMRRLDEAQARLYKEALAGLPPPKPGDARDIEVDKTLSEASAVIDAEMRITYRKLRWWAVAVTAMMLLWLAALYLRV